MRWVEEKGKNIVNNEDMTPFLPLFDSGRWPSGFAQACGLPLSATLRLKLADEMTELGFDPPSQCYGGTGNQIPASIIRGSSHI